VLAQRVIQFEDSLRQVWMRRRAKRLESPDRPPKSESGDMATSTQSRRLSFELRDSLSVDGLATLRQSGLIGVLSLSLASELLVAERQRMSHSTISLNTAGFVRLQFDFPDTYQKFSSIHMLDDPALPWIAMWRPSGEGRADRKTLEPRSSHSWRTLPFKST
jgi:hypothetical protein